MTPQYRQSSLVFMFNAEAHSTRAIHGMGAPLRLITRENSERYAGLFALKGQFLIVKLYIDLVKGLLQLAFLG